MTLLTYVNGDFLKNSRTSRIIEQLRTKNKIDSEILLFFSDNVPTYYRGVITTKATKAAALVDL